MQATEDKQTRAREFRRQQKRKNKLLYGTCRVVVSKTSVVQSIFGSIQEYAGFDRESWPD